MTGPARQPLGLFHRLGPLLLLAAAALGFARLISILNRIPNSEEEYRRLNATFLAMLAGPALVLLAGPLLGSRWPPLARAHRFPARALGLALLFWWLPVPFFLGRCLSWLLFYACAGVYLAVTLRAALLAAPGPIPRPAPWWAAAAAIAAVLLALLSDKQNSLAFSMAID